MFPFTQIEDAFYKARKPLREPAKFVWFDTGTGGGCTALQMNLTEGNYMLATDSEGCAIPTWGEPYIIGIYGPNGEPIHYIEGDAWRAA